MSCCGQCMGIEKEFGEKTARRELRRYRKKGPSRSTRVLLETLRQEGIGGSDLLDIGGGIGAIHHELLDDGVAGATHLDASTAYIAAAREEAERRGHASRTRFRHGDFVELAPELGAADVVTLDRVICCYPDMERLVGQSAAKARHLYGLVYPRRTWWLRLGFPLPNLYFRLRGSPFRVFLHDPEAVEAVVRRTGLERVARRELLVWQVVVYRRVAEGAAA